MSSNFDSTTKKIFPSLFKFQFLQDSVCFFYHFFKLQFYFFATLRVIYCDNVLNKTKLIGQFLTLILNILFFSKLIESF